jgi:hypothetical protein
MGENVPPSAFIYSTLAYTPVMIGRMLPLKKPTPQQQQQQQQLFSITQWPFCLFNTTTVTSSGLLVVLLHPLLKVSMGQQRPQTID